MDMTMDLLMRCVVVNAVIHICYIITLQCSVQSDNKHRHNFTYQFYCTYIRSSILNTVDGTQRLIICFLRPALIYFQINISFSFLPLSLNLFLEMGSCISKSDDQRNQASASSAAYSRIFHVFELAAACNSYSDRNLLGRGRFGPVYKGSFKHIDQLVAIKKLCNNADGRRGLQAFLAEARMLVELHHPNLVSTIGYCVDPYERLLVLEYMPLGSLDDHLFGRNSEMPPLNWNTRMRIALCVAHGLEYLHCKRGAPLIYRDLKCSNILLSEGYHAKLSAFALAEEGPVDAEPVGRITVVGSSGYVAPEYARTQTLNVKFDIYGFGAVLFEIITGRRFGEFVMGEDKDLTASALLNLADPLLEGNFPRDEYTKAAALTEKCLQADPDTRPVIGEIVHELSNLSETLTCNVM